MVIFEIYYGEVMPAYLRARILLRDDNHWNRLPIQRPPHVWGDCGLPMVGNWTKFREDMGLKAMPDPTGLYLVDGGTKQVGAALYQFFPATMDKTGRGRDAIDSLDVSYKIVKESMIARLSYQDKMVLACGTALTKMDLDALGSKVKELFTPPGVYMFAAFALQYIVKNPSSHFKLFKQVLGRALVWYMVIDYCNRFGRFFDMIGQAESVDKLQEAGCYLADLLMSLARDVGLTAIWALCEAYMGKQGSPGAQGRKQGTTTDPDAGNLKITPGPGDKVTIDVKDDPAQDRQDWREAFKDQVKKSEDLYAKARDASTPTEQMEFLVKAVKARMRAHLLRIFIIETIHHMEVVKRVAPLASEVTRQISSAIRNAKAKGSTASVRTDIGNYLIQCCQRGGVMLSQDEANWLAERFIDDFNAGRLHGEYDWSNHDCESFDISKFNRAIAVGMSKPIKIPRNWTPSDFEMAAQDINPKTSQPFTDKEMADLLGVDEYEFLKGAYDAPKAIWGDANQVNSSVAGHRAAPHHHPDTEVSPPGAPQRYWNVDGYMETGCDVGSAMVQWRGYRLKALDVDGILNMLGKRPDLPYCKLGIALIRTLGQSFDVVDPVRVVSTSMLQRYGQVEMVKEMGIGR